MDHSHMANFILFGGSFNPFHNGHFQMVHAAHKHCPKTPIILIPAGSPPHKQNVKQLSFEHRYQMLKNLAKEEGEWLRCSDIEGKATEPTYTLHTIRAFQKKHPKSKLFFLIGGDSLRDLPKWFCFKELVSEVQLLIIERPGVNTDAALTALEVHLSPYELNLLREHTIPMRPSELSSSKIREGIEAGVTLKETVPRAIFSYLEKRDLLGGF